LQGIQFETGKDVIIKTSYPILDKVVSVMNDNKEYNLEINGHTDNVGNDARNLALSQKRADAVKAYLVKKGIETSRMTATGFGETKPVEDNKTAAGKAKNRRVEFKVIF
jgi:outer membrane protein OmpA-like peptidoglycan-associated protein